MKRFFFAFVLTAILFALPASAQDGGWQERVEETLATVRRRPLTVRVLDADGNPVEGADVHVEQMRHAFLFGSALSNGFYRSVVPKETREKVLEDFLLLYNSITPENAAKWLSMQTSPNYYNDAVFEWMVEWAQENDLIVKGHVLVWGNLKQGERESSGVPAWTIKLGKSEDIMAAVDAHIEHTLEKYGADTVPLWDVVNEPLHARYYDQHDEDYVARAFRLADEVSPETVLILNEYSIITCCDLDEFYVYVKKLLDDGVPIDALGVQGHYWKNGTLTGADLTRRLDKLAELGLPIYISEFDLQLGWTLNGRIIDEEYQAEMYALLYKTAYGHPAVAGITSWGFWDRMIWREGGGVLDEEGSRKPAFDALYKLIREEWWTDDTLTTGAEGEIALDATVAEYAITVTVDGEEAAAQAYTLERGEGGTVLEVQLGK